ncbi:hypothetical protein BGZ76_009674 [Entomortierella beljakovae]|nr:hypothetical protein BGZ76_009674 [Entomortierella beljakovae]
MDLTENRASSAIQEDVDILKRELQALETRREDLLKQIEEEERITTEENASSASKPTVKSDKDQKRMRDILMAYRLTGVTLFDAKEFESGQWSNYNMTGFPTGSREIGIRFETFANGKYHEPYYVMIQRSNERQNDNGGSEGEDQLVISKHTIPHWIPLRDIERRYLNKDMGTFVRIVFEQLQEVVSTRESSNNSMEVEQDVIAISE